MRGACHAGDKKRGHKRWKAHPKQASGQIAGCPNLAKAVGEASLEEPQTATAMAAVQLQAAQRGDKANAAERAGGWAALGSHAIAPVASCKCCMQVVPAPIRLSRQGMQVFSLSCLSSLSLPSAENLTENLFFLA